MTVKNNILIQNFLAKQYFLFQVKDLSLCFPTKSLLLLIFVVHFPFANQQSTLMNLLLNGLGDCYWKHTLMKKYSSLVQWRFHYFSAFFAISMNVIFEKGLWDSVLLGRLPKTIPKKQQGGLSLEKVTKRWLWSWTVCSPWSLATGYLKAEGMSALQGFLRSCSSNGQRAIGSWGIPARDWVASQHPQGNPLGLRML